MPSFNQQLNQREQFIVGAKIFLPATSKKEFANVNRKSANCRALVDTGASGCCISENVVASLSLQPFKRSTIGTAGNPYVTSVYMVDLFISVLVSELRQETQQDGKEVFKPHPVSEAGVAFPQVEVFEIPGTGQDRGFDIILGMNVLASLHITMYGKQIIVSI